MTEEQWRRVEYGLTILVTDHYIYVDDQGAKDLIAYREEFNRMRQFIRNLADESKVYLESEE